MVSINRRRFLEQTSSCALGLLASGHRTASAAAENAARRPNILFAIADDWSWPFASAYGARGVDTPAFDRIAKEGCLFQSAFTAAPQCSPNRAATLTGRNIWQLAEAGTHGSIFPNTFAAYPDLLEKAGYHVGFTGKGWGPGDWKRGGWNRNPAGPEYSRRKRASVPATGIRNLDYAANFEDFLKKRPDGTPFCFWFGAFEPHRDYEAGSGIKAGKNPDSVLVPPFLPDTPAVRSDILDYFVEIEWFDAQLASMLRALEKIGELDNTLVVATSDNGMPFPHAKANLYEYGTHVPLAVRWPERVEGGRVLDALLSFIDFAPTFLEAAGLAPPDSMTGRSFLDVITGTAAGPAGFPRPFVLTGRERHSHARYDNLGYPSRAIRTQDYLYIRNFAPDRWPAGDPEGYHDIDAGPTLDFMRTHRKEYATLWDGAVGKRPAEELYDIRKDAACLRSLAEAPEYAETRQKLWGMLETALTQEQDPRVLGAGDIFESYPRVSQMRPELGGFAEQGAYNPKYAPNP